MLVSGLVASLEDSFILRNTGIDLSL